MLCCSAYDLPPHRDDALGRWHVREAVGMLCVACAAVGGKIRSGHIPSALFAAICRSGVEVVFRGRVHGPAEAAAGDHRAVHVRVHHLGGEHPAHPPRRRHLPAEPGPELRIRGSSARMAFTATGRPPGETPRKTRPMPPWPSCPTSRYGPIVCGSSGCSSLVKLNPHQISRGRSVLPTGADRTTINTVVRKRTCREALWRGGSGCLGLGVVTVPLSLLAVIVDCRDPRRQAEWWAHALERVRRRGDGLRYQQDEQQ